MLNFLISDFLKAGDTGTCVPAKLFLLGANYDLLESKVVFLFSFCTFFTYKSHKSLNLSNHGLPGRLFSDKGKRLMEEEPVEVTIMLT